MRKAAFLSGLLLFSSIIINAQDKFITKTGKISFFSAAALENIEATNKSAVCVLNSGTGDIQFAVLMKGFEFRKALMQEHFNRDFVESDQFPKAEFKGRVINNTGVNYTTNGTYDVNVKGSLTLHGLTKEIETTGTISVKDGRLQLHSVFNVLLADYKIGIPRMYLDNISKSIKVTVDCGLELMK